MLCTLATVASMLVLIGAMAGLGAGHLAGAIPSGLNAQGPASGSSVSRAFAVPMATALTLTPAHGSVGDTILATGTGFPVSQPISATWNTSTTLCGGNTTATGTFECNFTVPNAVQGAHTVTMTGSDSSATATFTVDPMVALSPATAGIGTTVTVTGSGYAATSTWTVTWSGTPQITCTGTVAHTNTNGGFACDFVVPLITPAIYTVTGKDMASPANTATATFTLPTPALTFTPAHAAVGDSVTVTGVGFIGTTGTTGYTVVVTWGPSGMYLCSNVTDMTGSFNCMFMAPTDVGGVHHVAAVDPVGNSATHVFTLDASLTLSPTSGPAATSVTATGMGFAGMAAAKVTWAPGGGTLCTATTDDMGNFACTFVVPSDTTGDHTVTGTAVGSATATFTLNGVVPTIAVALTNHFKLYMPIPINLTWTITASQAVSTTTTSMWLNVSDLGSSACPYIGSHPTRVVKAPCLVVSISLDYLLVDGQNSYATTLTIANLTSGGYNGGVLPYDTGYVIGLFVSMTNVGSTGIGGATQTVYMVTHPASASLVAPNPIAGVPLGNVTVGVTYTGDFVSGAVVNIYTTATPSALVFSSGVAVPGTGTRTGTAGAPWVAAVPGTYNAIITLSGPWGTANFTQPLTVFLGGGTPVYVNQTSYNNNSLIPGWGNGVTGMLLLLVGAIIGLIVAMVLGRMMWSETKPAPAQPWQGKPNECSVCHQAFDNDSELKDHMRKAHGM
jgi:hypothetical protein